MAEWRKTYWTWPSPHRWRSAVRHISGRTTCWCWSEWRCSPGHHSYLAGLSPNGCRWTSRRPPSDSNLRGPCPIGQSSNSHCLLWCCQQQWQQQQQQQQQWKQQQWQQQQQQTPATQCLTHWFWSTKKHVSQKKTTSVDRKPGRRLPDPYSNIRCVFQSASPQKKRQLIIDCNNVEISVSLFTHWILGLCLVWLQTITTNVKKKKKKRKKVQLTVCSYLIKPVASRVMRNPNCLNYLMKRELFMK